MHANRAISNSFSSRIHFPPAALRVMLGVIGLAFAVVSCSDTRRNGDDGGSRASETEDTPVGEDLLTTLDEQTPEVQFVLQPWHGDLDEIIDRRYGLIRLLTVFEPMHYAVDGRKQGGITFEAAREFEKFLNQRLDITRAEDRLHVVLIPVRRDELIPFIRDGRGDIAAANLTVTEERLREVDFSEPFVSDAYEIVVTAPDVEPVLSLDDLSGRTVYVRKSSSYRESLETVNRDLAARGMPGVEIESVDELLDDGAILELVNEGDLPVTVVDAHIAEFWLNFFPNLVLNDSARPREHSRIAFAVQKGASELVDHINAFAKTHGKGSLLGNVLIRRYFESPEWVKTVSDAEVVRRLDTLKPYFQASAERHDLDWRRLAAQGWQESGLDQNRRSSRGAVGVMQLMPATAAEMGMDDVSTAEANIEAGARYMRHVIDTYFSEAEDNPSLDPENARNQAYALALASYNAGPSRIARLRRQAADRGFDPNVWFGELEPVVARSVGIEPVNYVDNIFEYSVRIQLQQRLHAQQQELGSTASAR